MQVLQASATANVTSQSVTHLPIAGDVLWFLHLHNRQPTPRSATAMAGNGGTWTRESAAGDQRLYVYRCTDANATGNATITLSGSFTGGAMLLHLRPDAGEDLTNLDAFSLAENLAGGTSQVGPAQDAHRGKIVATFCLGGNPATLDHSGSSGLYTPVAVGSSAFMDAAVAMPFDLLGATVSHQITMNCASSAGMIGVAQIVIGDADPGPTPIRFYPTTTSSPLPGVTPTRDSLWDVTTSSEQRLLTQIPLNQAMSDTTRSETVAGNVDVLCNQNTTWPVFPAMTLAGTFRLLMQPMEGNADQNAFLNCVIRGVDETGTTFRTPTAYPGQGGHTASPSSSDPKYEFNVSPTRGTRRLEKPLVPMVLTERDRLVLEFGSSSDEPGTTSRTITWRLGDPASVADLPWAVDDTSTTQRPWFELHLIDPPLVPGDVECEAAGSTVITLTWTAPTGFGVPDGYEVQIDGGGWVDIGDVLTWDFTGLAPGTSYEVEVRAYNEAGFGPAASCEATTDSGPSLIATVIADDGVTHIQQELSDTNDYDLYIAGQ